MFCLLALPGWAAGVITDGDGDGVAFEDDACPYTRPGVPVDAQGCSDQPDADGDGIPDIDDRCPVSPRGADTGPDGCSIDTDNDGVADGLDQCPATLAREVPNAVGCSASQLTRPAAGSTVTVGRPATGSVQPQRPIDTDTRQSSATQPPPPQTPATTSDEPVSVRPPVTPPPASTSTTRALAPAAPDVTTSGANPRPSQAARVGTQRQQSGAPTQRPRASQRAVTVDRAVVETLLGFDPATLQD